MESYDMTCLFFDAATGTCEADGAKCNALAVEYALRMNAHHGPLIDCVEAAPCCFSVIPRGEVEESLAFVRGEPPPRRFIVEDEA
jgi:hypothetical protein